MVAETVMVERVAANVIAMATGQSKLNACPAWLIDVVSMFYRLVV